MRGHARALRALSEASWEAYGGCAAWTRSWLASRGVPLRPGDIPGDDTRMRWRGAQALSRGAGRWQYLGTDPAALGRLGDIVLMRSPDGGVHVAPYDPASGRVLSLERGRRGVRAIRPAALRAVRCEVYRFAPEGKGPRSSPAIDHEEGTP